MKELLLGLGVTTALVLGLAGPASAHVAPSVSEAPAGSYQAITFRIGHGCDGADGDTDRVEIQMPEGVESATPQFLPGWDATVDDAGPVVVTWTGGPLPTDQYQEFGVSVQMPDTPGEMARFPTVQTCVSGEELAWIEETPEGGPEPEYPAPAVAIGVSTGDGTNDQGDDGGGEEGAVADDDEAAAADVSPDRGDRDALAMVALVVGALGLLAGGYAVLSTRRAG